jgi:hypothetical protein
VNRWVAQVLEAVLDSTTTVIGPRPQVIGPKPGTVVAAPPRFAWDEKRWRRVDANGQTEVVGRFRVHDRRRNRWHEFDGRLVQTNREVAAYIADPPVEMKHHRHGACLQLVKAPWFRLHWGTQPKTLDDALIYMERMLDESFNERR